MSKKDTFAEAMVAARTVINKEHGLIIFYILKLDISGEFRALTFMYDGYLVYVRDSDNYYKINTNEVHFLS